MSSDSGLFWEGFRGSVHLCWQLSVRTKAWQVLPVKYVVGVCTGSGEECTDDCCCLLSAKPDAAASAQCSQPAWLINCKGGTSVSEQWCVCTWVWAATWKWLSLWRWLVPSHHYRKHVCIKGVIRVQEGELENYCLPAKSSFLIYWHRSWRNSWKQCQKASEVQVSSSCSLLAQQ